MSAPNTVTSALGLWTIKDFKDWSYFLGVLTGEDMH